jgi:hypothetical protein
MVGLMDVLPDQLRSRTLLDVEATYRVMSLQGEHVLMQVVDVPGLAPGLRFRMELSVVATMDVVNARTEVAEGLASLLAEAA